VSLVYCHKFYNYINNLDGAAKVEHVLTNISQRPLGKAIKNCRYQDFVSCYLNDFIVYKYGKVQNEFHEVRFTASCYCLLYWCYWDVLNV